MTDIDQSETTAEESNHEAGTPAPGDGPSDGPERASDPTTADTDQSADNDIISERMRQYLYRGAFVALALFGLFAAVQFYANVSRTISLWVTPDYKPLFQAAFNLVVVLACGLGLTVLVDQFR
jgi:hypothetical protein